MSTVQCTTVSLTHPVLCLQEVDLVVASLSVTTSRQTVMDFVDYFFEYGSMLLKKPDEHENKPRVIIQPFSWKVEFLHTIRQNGCHTQTNLVFYFLKILSRRKIG